MRKIKLLIVLFLAVPVWKKYQKINFPIVLSGLSVLKPIPEVSVICILCCKFKNLTTMYAVNKVASCLFLVSICIYNIYVYIYLSLYWCPNFSTCHKNVDYSSWKSNSHSTAALHVPVLLCLNFCSHVKFLVVD